MSSASNYYITHSTPSPAAAGSSDSSSSTPPPPPSRTLLLLQSPTTRSHLARIYTVSGGAVKLSHKAAAVAERLIIRAVSADKGKGRGASASAIAPASAVPTPPRPPPSPKPSLSPRSRGPSRVPPQSYLPPPDKPAPPPRRGGTSPASSRGPSPTPPSAPLRARTRAALSASLILASLFTSSVRLVDAGSAAVAGAVSHRYGAVAGNNAALAGGTIRNVFLVYVDMRGFGRRALVKRTVKTWVKGHVTSRGIDGPKRSQLK